MFKKIPKTFINELLSKTNIIRLIESKISLKKVGDNYQSKCPFHKEKNPSFKVSESKQFYYCFGCGIYGNAIDFLIKFDKLSFLDAIKELSHFCGIEFPYERTNPIIQKKLLKNEKLSNFMKEINICYQNSLFLKESYEAREYLFKKRGLNKEIITKFSIGFSQENCLKKILKNKKNKKYLVLTGILINKNNKIYEHFRKRIIFPIKNLKGQLIAFGGRCIKDNILPKYLNSPETKLFKKSYVIYGLYEVLNNNIKPHKLLVVEGYIDVITLHQYNIKYSVGILGTSITKYQINILFNTVNTVIFCFDGDQSGFKAAWKTLNLSISFLNEKKILQFMFLPIGEDPDSLIRKEGKKNFEKRINKAILFSSFFFKILLKNINLNQNQGKIKFFQISISFIKKIPSDVLKIYLINCIKKITGIYDRKIILSLIKDKNSYQNKKKFFTQSFKKNTIRTLVSLLIQNKNLIKFIQNKEQLEQSNLPKINVLLKIIKLIQTYPKINTGQLLEKNRDNVFKKDIINILKWKKMKQIRNIDELIFKDVFKKLLEEIKNEKFKSLMKKERIKGLTKEEKKEINSIILEKNFKT